jgi:phosphoglycerol transferase MdoB-like AlkP superfamily enzyme
MSDRIPGPQRSDRLPTWRGRSLWRYFIGLVFLFTALQVGARFALQLTFFRESLSFSQAAIAHFYGLRFDLRLACLIACVPLLSGSLPWIGRWLHPVFGRALGSSGKFSWFWPLLGSIIVALWSFALYADFGNMAYWQQRLNVGVLLLLQDLQTNTKVLWDSYPVAPLAISTILLASASFVFSKHWSKRIALQESTTNASKRNTVRGLKAFLINFSLVALVLFLIHGRWSQYPLRWSDLVRVGHPPAEQLAINPIQNIADTLAYRKPQFETPAAVAAYPTMAPWLQIPVSEAKPLNYARTPAARAEAYFPKDANVVIVILESLSGYKTSLHGNKLNPTPYLKELADQGWWFSRFSSAHPFTARGVYSILTSRPDVTAGDTASRNPQAIKHQSLIAAWDKHQPFYFIGGSTSWANIRGLVTKAVPKVQIFEEENFKTPRTDVWGLSDRNLFYESLKILNRHSQERQQPFFAVIQTAANHRPYTIPTDDPEFKVATTPEAEVLTHGMGGGTAEYNAIRLMDHSVAKFIERARKSAWFDNTVFVFLGDHGTIGDVPGYMPPWMQAKDVASIHTPLIVYAPRFLKPKQLDTLGQQADLLPTLLDMSGRSSEHRGLGRSLVSERPGQAGMLFSFHVGGTQYGWFDGRYYAKLIDGGNSPNASMPTAKSNDSAAKTAALLARVQLYDLSDPKKHNIDIANQSPEEAKRLGSFLEAYYQTARYLVMNP